GAIVWLADILADRALLHQANCVFSDQNAEFAVIHAIFPLELLKSSVKIKEGIPRPADIGPFPISGGRRGYPMAKRDHDDLDRDDLEEAADVEDAEEADAEAGDA